jgi:hypothetical protein
MDCFKMEYRVETAMYMQENAAGPLNPSRPMWSAGDWNIHEGCGREAKLVIASH